MAGPGYSGASLARELGIKAGCRLHLKHAPEGFLADVIVAFHTERDELERDMRSCATGWTRPPAGAPSGS